MQSRITNIIPEQGFEKIRDLIGAILLVELLNQKSLREDLKDEIAIYVGRLKPFAAVEKLMINILVDSADYSSNHEKGTHDKTNYFIDIHVAAEETVDFTGGYEATKKRDKFIGLVRYILQDHHYKTLAQKPGIIMNTSVDGFENFQGGNSQDAAFIKMARITYSVGMYEDQSLWAGVNINSIFTDIKLNLTEKGYKYEVIN